MGGVAGAAAGEDVGEIEGGIVGPELHEEVEDFGEDLGGSSVGSVDLIDDDDGLQVTFEGFSQDEAGLRFGAFGGIDEHEDAVGHFEDALDLTAEVGVARGVDDVDLGALVGEGDVFGEDGDAAFALEIVRVENAIALELGVAEQTGLAHEGVDEGGFPVVNVGDDGDVANVVASGHESQSVHKIRRPLGLRRGIQERRAAGHSEGARL